ncbi:ATP-grasp peptide maturase system methyltransferase [Nonomuraea sp. NPDC000554]|uniref:ATP-grasp peptide maturase system methyltransferase n=1 Tax=Nonomuraea sp. NPDC000554 TaxID=3154259 RepID=UPI00332EF888
MRTLFDTRRRELAAWLAAEDPRWKTAVADVPRELFLGEAVYRAGDGPDGTVWEPVRRDGMTAEQWSRLAYEDATWVTQIGGVLAEDAGGGLSGDPTSSSTLPGLVVRMLEAAGIGDGDRVLEIGTGTGYSTALLCHRLGDGKVTSIEYDPAVARRARSALTAAGCAPTLVVGDGLAGYEPNAEYDRLIATCSVRYVPAAWMWEVRDGGTITAPLAGWMGGTALAHITLAGDGTACGRFPADDIGFMFARPHGRPPLSSYLIGLGDERDSLIDPRLLDDSLGVFVAQLGAPSAQKLGLGDEIILLDVATGSQATTRPCAGGWTVRQHGPLRLWDSVEDAVLAWQKAGSPDWSGFGLTVTQEGQRVWLGSPSGPSWNLPA